MVWYVTVGAYRELRHTKRIELPCKCAESGPVRIRETIMREACQYEMLADNVRLQGGGMFARLLACHRQPNRRMAVDIPAWQQSLRELIQRVDRQAPCHRRQGQEPFLLGRRSRGIPVFFATALDDLIDEARSIEVADVLAAGDSVGHEIGKQRPALFIDLRQGRQCFSLGGQRFVRLIQNELENWPGVGNGRQWQILGSMSRIDLCLCRAGPHDLVEPIAFAGAFDKQKAHGCSDSQRAIGRPPARHRLQQFAGTLGIARSIINDDEGR